jgi:GNAT superfamily N-acetyltransferase
MIQYRRWQRDEYIVSNDPARLQLDVIHRFLTHSYWAQNIPRELVARSIDGSVAYGIYHQDGDQVGFARVVTDRATFGYLADVFVLEEHRSRGLATWLMQCILETPELADFRRWLLITRDAHALYRGVGFAAPAKPENIMEKVRRDPYGVRRD